MRPIGEPGPIPAGEVTETDPQAGTEVDEGSTVVVYFSEGLGSARVPDVGGLPEDEATTTLEARGFINVTTTKAFSDSLDEGLVIRTDPVAGQESTAIRRSP